MTTRPLQSREEVEVGGERGGFPEASNEAVTTTADATITIATIAAPKLEAEATTTALATTIATIIATIITIIATIVTIIAKVVTIKLK